MITENLSTLRIHKLSQEQYDREFNSGNLDERAIYLTPTENTSWEFKRVLTSSDDLNDIKEEGVYVYSTDSRPANCPYENAGIVEVIKTNSTTGKILQRITRYGVGGETAFRTLYNNNWNTWAKVATDPEWMLTTHRVKETGKDLNDFITPGLYFFDSEHQPTNMPSDNANGWLLVLCTSNTSMKKQMWFRGGALNSTDYQTYVRTYIGGWGNWVRLATDLEVPKKPTGSYTGNGASSRTISIGGDGSIVYIYGLNGEIQGFATAKDGFSWYFIEDSSSDNGKGVKYSASEANFSDGILYFAGQSNLNTSGKTYCYQVL